MGTMSVEPPGPTRLSETEKLPSGVRCRAYGRFVEWLEVTGGSVAATTYNSGRLIVLAASEGRLHWRSWKFERPMGIATDGRRMALATRRAVLRLAARRSAAGGRIAEVSQTATGRVDAHDVALLEGRVLFANTRRNCIARAQAPAGVPRLLAPVVRRPARCGATSATSTASVCATAGWRR